MESECCTTGQDYTAISQQLETCSACTERVVAAVREPLKNGQTIGRVVGAGYYVVYDAGNFQDNGATCIDAVEELVPASDDIDLMILSRSDADHMGGADEGIGVM